MTIDSILAEIDAEIARLSEARRLLSRAGSSAATRATASPRKSKASSAGKARRKRVLSPEARKRIADAQKRRWAAQKSRSKKEA